MNDAGVVRELLPLPLLRGEVKVVLLLISLSMLIEVSLCRSSARTCTVLHTNYVAVCKHEGLRDGRSGMKHGSIGCQKAQILGLLRSQHCRIGARIGQDVKLQCTSRNIAWASSFSGPL
jgi:hypothetical protein